MIKTREIAYLSYAVWRVVFYNSEINVRIALFETRQINPNLLICDLSVYTHVCLVILFVQTVIATYVYTLMPMHCAVRELNRVSLHTLSSLVSAAATCLSANLSI